MVRRRRKRGAAVEMGQHCRGNDSLVVEPRARIVVVAIAITKGQSWSMVESSGAWDWWRLSLPASPCLPHSALPTAWRDRKGVVWGKRVSVRVNLGGRRLIKKKKRNMNM